MKKYYIACILLISANAQSYDLRTHAQITQRAYDASVMASSDLYTRLGLKSLKPVGTNEYGLEKKYYDFERYTAPTAQGERIGFPFDLGLENVADAALTSTRTWLMRGAVREDDGSAFINKYAASARYGPDPQDDPFGAINRFCYHFYDPLYDRGLTPNSLNVNDAIALAGCGASAEKLVNWAIGTNDAFATAVQPASTYRNHFTVFAAREAMWRALTLTMKQQSGGYTPLLYSSATPAERETESRKYWTTVFRILGDTLHLIQDSAQPQHTRNEGHGVGHAAEYERFIDARANGDSEFSYDDAVTGSGKSSTQLKALVFDPPYPVPTLPSFTDYWTTERGSAPRTSSTTVGRGIADYSSRGFLTPGSGLGNSNYPSPSPNRANYAIVSETPATADDCGFLRPYQGNAPSVSWNYAKISVPDNVAGTSAPIRMQTVGFLDKYLQSRLSITRHYGFNECTWNDRAALLLPRAVAYSAGVINHFFRGKMEIKLPPEGVYAIIDHGDDLNNCKDTCGFKKIKAKLKNTTPDIIASGTSTSYPQNMVNGEMVAIAKFHRNNCYRPDLRGEYVRAFGVNTGINQAEITFSNSWQDCRTVKEESIVSKATSGVNLAAGTENSYSFDFDKPIPINATDLFLQIVFRGKLGDDEDAVAVQTLDISEPNYVVFASPAGGTIEFGGTASALCIPFDTSAVSTSGAPSPWCRVAYIVGTDNYHSNSIDRCSGSGYSLKPAQLQVDEATGTYANANWANNGTKATNMSPFNQAVPLDGTAPSWSQVAACYYPSGLYSNVILQSGLRWGLNSTTGGGGVNYYLPPAKVQSINF
jgi:hypothetical protein